MAAQCVLETCLEAALLSEALKSALVVLFHEGKQNPSDLNALLSYSGVRRAFVKL